MATVLIVEDDEDLLEVLALLLKHARVGHVGAQSLAEVQALPPAQLADLALAVIDINLGRDQPNGLEVARWLRAQGYAGKLVFMTGHAPDHPLVRAAAGDDGEVLEKPVEARTLIALAKAACG